MNRAARIGLTTLGLALILAAFALACWAWAPASWLYSSKIALGNSDARKIDAFRQRTGRFPSKLEDVGITVGEDGPVYYERCSGTRYILWFGTTLGESMTFDSANHTWVSLKITCSERK